MYFYKLYKKGNQLQVPENTFSLGQILLMGKVSFPSSIIPREVARKSKRQVVKSIHVPLENKREVVSLQPITSESEMRQ